MTTRSATDLRVLLAALTAATGLCGCAVAGKATGTNGGTAKAGSATVVIGAATINNITLLDKEQCQVELGRIGIEYTQEKFMDAVLRGTEKAVKLFLQCGMPPDTVVGGRQALQQAAYFKNESMIRLLLSGGAKVNSNASGLTPMYQATQGVTSSRNVAVVELLLGAHADPNALCYGQGPLFWAAKAKRADVVKVLLKYKGVREAQGPSTLRNAAGTDRPSLEVVRLLVDAGIKANSIRGWKESDPGSLNWPLGYLASGSYKRYEALEPPVTARGRAQVDVACLLLGAGASADAKNWEEKSVLTVTREAGYADMATFVSACCNNAAGGIADPDERFTRCATARPGVHVRTNIALGETAALEAAYTAMRYLGLEGVTGPISDADGQEATRRAVEAGIKKAKEIQAANWNYEERKNQPDVPPESRAELEREVAKAVDAALKSRAESAAGQTASVLGHWAGTVNPERGPPYSMVLDVKSTGPGRCGVVSYPSLNCDSEWWCDKASDGRTLKASEKITQGQKNCRGGEVTISAAPDGQSLELDNDDARRTPLRRSASK